MGTRAAARAAIESVAEELGLPVTGGLLRRVRAAGPVGNGLVELSLVREGEGGAMEAADGAMHGSSAAPTYGRTPEGEGWAVRAVSTHHDLGVGLRLTATSTPLADRPAGALAFDHADFDATISVRAVNVERVRTILDEPTRLSLLGFFASGAAAVISDTDIRIASGLPARALAAQLRNAARMSSVLTERIAEVPDEVAHT